MMNQHSSRSPLSQPAVLSIFLLSALFFITSLFPAIALAWRMEAGEITLPAVSTGSTSFSTVSLQQTYATTPLIFILPAAENSRPAAVRVRNVTTTGFEAAQVEPPNEDGSQPATTVHYLAVEAGLNQLPDGTVLEAGTLSTTSYQGKNLSGTGWDTVSFSSGFSAAPAILAQIQTMNNESAGVPGAASVPWMTTTIQSVTTTGFQLALERAETSTGSVGSVETIAYLAVRNGANGSFTDNGGSSVTYEALVSSDAITGNCTWVNFANSYSPIPLVIGTQNRRDGGDGGWLRRCGSPNIESSRISLEIDEDLLDGERDHTTESAGILVFSRSFNASFSVLTRIADYHLDECDYTTGPASDDTGNYPGTYSGSVTSTEDPGGTCRVGSFSGGAVDLTGLPVSTTAGDQTTVSFWMNWDGSNSVMPFGWNRYDLWLTSDRFGFNTFNSDVYGISNATATLANGWHHIVAVFTNGDVSLNKLYIDGVARAISQVQGSPNNGNAYVNAGARIGGVTSTSSYRFSGMLDEVMIFTGELPAAEIATIYANQLADNNYDGSSRSCAICTTVRADYHFDQCAWNGTAGEVVDSGGNNYHGVANNATTSTTARFCRAGDFTADSITDYVGLDNRAADGLTDFTVSAWIKTGNSGSQAILSGANSAQANEMLMWLNSSTQFMPFIKGSSATIAISDIADNAWHHLVWTRSGTSNCIYRDGALQGCAAIGTTAAVAIDPGGLIIGQEQDSVGNGFAISQDFEGYIDQVRIYNGELSGTEVATLYAETQDQCPSCVSPAAEWRFDECSWNGTSGEVIDAQGSLHGTRAGNADTIASGKLCRAGTFDGIGDYVDMGDILNTVFGSTSNAFTITAWLKPTVLTAGVTNHQTANTFIAKASDLYNDNIEIGVNPNGTLHLYLDTQGRDSYADLGVAGAIQTGQWTFVAITYDNGTVTATINDTTYTDTTTWSGGGNIDNAANSPFTVGASLHIDNYFTGEVDEVRVYPASLDAAALAAIKAETRSSCTSCSIPVADYHLDECDFSSGQVIDSTGNYHGSPTGTVTTSEDPGRTCRVGSFSGGAVDLTGLPVSTTAGDQTTVSFWMNWDGSNSVMPFGWNRYDLWLTSDRFGFNTFNSDVYGISNATATLANGWHHIVAVFTNGDVSLNKLYIDGVARAISQLQGSPNNGNAYVNAGARIGGATSNSGYRFSGMLDEVMIFTGELPAAEIATIYANQLAGNNYDGTARSCPCGLVSVDHYAISHDATGITCLADPITITAHDVAHGAVAPANSTVITLSTSTGRGTWARVVTGSGSLNDPVPGDGGGTYTFPGSESNVVLAFNYTNPAGDPESVNFNISDGTNSEDPSEDSSIVFASSGFRFYNDSDANTTIPTQIAGKDSDIAPNARTISLQAIRTSDDDPTVCQPIFASGSDVSVQLGAECLAPAGCSGNQVRVINNAVTTAITTSNDNGGAGAAGYTPVSLRFGAGSKATLAHNYPDAGRIQLHARYNIPLDNGSPSGKYMTGSSNSFVTRPAGLCVYSNDIDADCAAGDGTCSKFKKAGTSFNLKIKGVGWETAGEADTDFCTGNSTTPNFRLDNIALSPNLVSPSGGNNGTVGINAFNMAAADSGEHTINNQTISEVGVFTFTADPPAYLTAGDVIPASTSANIGRFYPYRYVLSVNSPLFNHGCATGSFTYQAQPFGFGVDPVFTIEARNAADATTSNCGGNTTAEDFWNLAAPTLAAGNYADQVGATPTLAVPTPGSAVFSNINDYDGFGTLTVSSTSLTYSRPAAATTPFNALVDLSLNAADLTDSDGACYDAEPDLTCDSFTKANISGTELRWGRFNILNSYGPETDDLAVPLTVQYYTATGFSTNSADSCTSASITLGSYSDNLASGETCVQDTGSPGASNAGCAVAGPVAKQFQEPPAAGDFNLYLKAPGAGNNGSVDVTVSEESNGAWLPAATSTATFGIFRGNDRIINWREILR
ncbi:MAG: hypothetical protein L3J03_10455 [Desulfobacterales bacterium]|nr:hypothetical protein [Desulfobacterales bacterium]